MADLNPFYLQHENVTIFPALHYTLETAVLLRSLFLRLQPDCVAVELPETMQAEMVSAATRLPDISVVCTSTQDGASLVYLSSPDDASFEGLRSAVERGIAACCIDLDVDFYPYRHELLPDPYSIMRIGHSAYYSCCQTHKKTDSSAIDADREQHMARRLKELSLRYEKVLFICGMAHAAPIQQLLSKNRFEMLQNAPRRPIRLCTITEESCREILSTCGFFLQAYESWRHAADDRNRVDRHKLQLNLYKEAAKENKQSLKSALSAQTLRTMMRFSRNYALIKGALQPDLYQIIIAARGAVDHNYAYEVWKLATDYPYLCNLEGLEELSLTAEQLWGNAKRIRFSLLDKRKKGGFFQRAEQQKNKWSFADKPTAGFCSYQPEDFLIENFAKFLQKRGERLLLDEAARSLPFSTSLEDGVDMRETIRHISEHKLYVKVRGKTRAPVGSVVVIFDEDSLEQPQESLTCRYPWCATWHGEHHQESDMAFYATPMNEEIVGPGICRCRYGGLMMTYPPRRVYDVWSDEDYLECRSKPEILLMAAIDYSIEPHIAYAAASPPRSSLRSYARRKGKKIVYLPLGQFSPSTLARLRSFHVLDGQQRRQIADDYIF